MGLFGQKWNRNKSKKKLRWIKNANPRENGDMAVLRKIAKDDIDKAVKAAATSKLNECYKIENGTLTAYDGVQRVLRVPEGVIIVGKGALEGNNMITGLVFPDSVVHIEKNAFKNCKQVKNIVLPNSVLEIGEEAFAQTGIKTIVIPDNIETIGKKAFHCCRQLASIALGKSVKSIGEEAFSWCESLEEVTVLANIPPTIDKKAFGACKPWFTLKIPLEHFEDYAWSKDWLFVKECSNAIIEIIKGVKGVNELSKYSVHL